MRRSPQAIPNIKLIFAYLLISCPTLIILVFVTGPFQVPDEPSHFYRAIQLSHGQVMPVLAPGGNAAGGFVEPAAQSLAERLGAKQIRLDPTHRFHLSDLFTPPVAASPPSFAVFSNTVIYFPVAHAVPALAIFVARGLGAPAIDWLYAGRLANAFIAVVISAAAIAMLDEAALFALVFATLPMVFFEEASLSADATVIPFSILFVALLARIAGARPLNWLFHGLLFVTLLYIAVGKIAYIPFAVLPPAIAIFNRRPLHGVVKLSAISIIVVVTWAVWAKLMHNDVFPIRSDVYVNVDDQMRFIVAHPVQFVLALVHTWYAHGTERIAQLVGSQLGNGDLLLPKIIVFLMLASLILATALKPHRSALRWPAKLAVLACLGLSFLLINVFLYLQDTAVGHHLIDGMQGRYLLPLIAFLPAVIPAKILSPSLYRRLCAGLVVIQIIGAATTAIFIWRGYWV